MEDGADDRLNDLLIDFAHAADLDAIFLRDVTGRTAAASNARGSRIYASQIYNSCPNFKSAMNGMRHYGIGATKGLPECFIADPSRAVRCRAGASAWLPSRSTCCSSRPRALLLGNAL